MQISKARGWGSQGSSTRPLGHELGRRWPGNTDVFGEGAGVPSSQIQSSEDSNAWLSGYPLPSPFAWLSTVSRQLILEFSEDGVLSKLTLHLLGLFFQA